MSAISWGVKISFLKSKAHQLAINLFGVQYFAIFNVFFFIIAYKVAIYLRFLVNFKQNCESLLFERNTFYTKIVTNYAKSIKVNNKQTLGG